MSHDQPLHWVQRNRSKARDHAQPVGESIARYVEQTVGSGLEAARRVAAVLAGLVDNEFREHCRIVCVPEGVVVVNVDVPALVQPIRVRWLTPLRTALRREKTGGMTADRLVFAYGTVGVGLPVLVETHRAEAGRGERSGPGERERLRNEAHR